MYGTVCGVQRYVRSERMCLEQWEAKQKVVRKRLHAEVGPHHCNALWVKARFGGFIPNVMETSKRTPAKQ